MVTLRYAICHFHMLFAAADVIFDLEHHADVGAGLLFQIRLIRFQD